MGVKSSFSLSGQHHFSLSQPPSSLQWIPRASNAIVTLFTPPAASRHKWPRPFRKKACHAGQRRALEHVSVLPTVDAASPDHLEPPPRASRGASTSATRHRAGPLVSPSLSPPAVRAQSRPARPMHGLARASTRALPRSSSLFLAPHSTPTNAVDSPSPSLLASRAIVAATRAPRPR